MCTHTHMYTYVYICIYIYIFAHAEDFCTALESLFFGARGCGCCCFGLVLFRFCVCLHRALSVSLARPQPMRTGGWGITAIHCARERKDTSKPSRTQSSRMLSVRRAWPRPMRVQRRILKRRKLCPWACRISKAGPKPVLSGKLAWMTEARSRCSPPPSLCHSAPPAVAAYLITTLRSVRPTGWAMRAVWQEQILASSNLHRARPSCCQFGAICRAAVSSTCLTSL